LVERFERQLVQEALRTAGSVSQAAEHLGIPRKTLYDKLKRLGLEPPAAP
jgi:two-component system C4-dicarboxylate transport response regulator DctD